MNTEELLEAVQVDPAYLILDEVNPNYRKRFKRLCGSLSKLMREIQEDFPDANFYADDSGTLLLVLGETHKNSLSGGGNQDLVAENSNVTSMSGGGW